MPNRDLVKRAATEAGIILSVQYGQHRGKPMPISDLDSLISFVEIYLRLRQEEIIEIGKNVLARHNVNKQI